MDYEKYFNEGKDYRGRPSNEVVADFIEVCKKAQPEFGRNKDCHKYIRGYCLSYYHHYGIFFEPITFNLDTLKHTVHYDEMNFPNNEAQKKHIRLKSNPVVILERFCYVFTDGKKQYEFFFDEKKLFDKKNKIEFGVKLNELFFIRPFSEQLELDLEEKPNKKKPKL